MADGSGFPLIEMCVRNWGTHTASAPHLSLVPLRFGNSDMVLTLVGEIWLW